MMVAAHNYDLAAAQALGLRTAFVPRPLEYGPGQTTDLVAEASGTWWSIRSKSSPPRSAANSKGERGMRCPSR